MKMNDDVPEAVKKGMLSIAFDFDGVLAEYNGWKGIDHHGAPIDGARELLRDLRGMGYRIIIFTTRLSPTINGQFTVGELAAKLDKWFNEHNVEYDELWVSPGKPLALAYVDDRAVNCRPDLYGPTDAFTHAFDSIQSLVDEIKKEKDVDRSS